VVPCLALFDTMKYIGSDVGTVGFGACMGMSGFMLAMGAKARAPRGGALLARSRACSPRVYPAGTGRDRCRLHRSLCWSGAAARALAGATAAGGS